MRLSTTVVRFALLTLLSPALAEAASCPTVVGFEPTAGLSTVDTGWTGLAMGRPIYGNVLRLGIDCGVASPPCGTCPVMGLLPDADGMFQRCRADTSVPCTKATEVGDCGGPDTCAVFITVPQSTHAAGVGACYTHELTSPVTGTVGVESGTIDVHLAYQSRLYTAQNGTGCPSCEGDPVPNDGIRGGTCDSGPRAFLACDGNGPSLPPWDELGTSSFDCPPSAAVQIATFAPGVVTYSTGTQTRTLDAASPGCGGATGRRCFCATCNDAAGEPCTSDADCPPTGGNPGLCGLRCDGGPNQGAPCRDQSECPSAACAGVGHPTEPNFCFDDDSTPIDESFLCQDTPPLGDGKGECANGPADTFCANHPNRGCLTSADCDGGACSSRERPCFVTTGAIGDTLSVTGVATPPAGDESDPTTLGMITCLGTSGSQAVDDVSGLPGITENLHVGRLTFYADPSSPGGCPVAPATCRASVVAGKSSLLVNDRSPDTKDQLRWRWADGAATTLAELGDPTTSDHYDLCLYDANGLRASMVIPAGGTCGGKPCWKATAKRFRYQNPSGSPRGITKLQLTSGADGKASIKVDGKGDLLPLPGLDTLSGSLQLQIRNRTSGLCWGTTFTPPFRRATASQIVAKD